MRICFALLPGFGHVYPVMPLALAAEAAGHQVTVAVSAEFSSRLPLTCVSVIPELAAVRREASQLDIDRSDAYWMPKALFRIVAPSHVRPRLIELWDGGEPPDLVVYEVSNIGAAQAAAQRGVPAAAFRIGTHVPDLFATELLPASGVTVSTLIDPVPPGWTDGGVAAPDARRIPIRTVAWSDVADPAPEWLTRPGPGPTAYLTLGTAFGTAKGLRAVILETAEHCARLLVATGPMINPDDLGNLPPQVHVERFVNQPAVLPLVDVAVHHGGTGTVLGCLQFGVRQVLTPQGADQFGNGATLRKRRLGAVVNDVSAAPGAVGEAVAQVLADASLGPRLAAISEEIAAMPDPSVVAEELQSLVA